MVNGKVGRNGARSLSTSCDPAALRAPPSERGENDVAFCRSRLSVLCNYQEARTRLSLSWEALRGRGAREDQRGRTYRRMPLRGGAVQDARRAARRDLLPLLAVPATDRPLL